MTLTNYWWLLIWLFAGGAIFNNIPRRQERLLGRTVERWNILPALALVLPYIIWAGFRESNGDTGLYRIQFLQISASWAEITTVIQAEDFKDPGFSVLMILMKMVIGNQDRLFFFLIAAFQMICVALVFRRYSSQYWLCIFLFIVSTDYISWMHNGMRQFIAATMIFACTGWLIRKKFIPLVLVILLASTIHGSALLMLPIVLIVQGRAWNRKTVLMLAATAVVVLYVDRFTPILNDLLQETQYDDLMTNGIWDSDDGTNIFRVLVYSAPALLSLFGRKYIRAANDPVLNIGTNCSIVTMALYLVAAVSSGIYIGRLPIYTTLQGYVVLPKMIDCIFERRSARLVKIIMIVLYLAFFYYQMHVAWSVL